MNISISVQETSIVSIELPVPKEKKEKVPKEKKEKVPKEKKEKVPKEKKEKVPKEKKADSLITEYFINQQFRKDVFANMLSNKHLTGQQLFDLIMEKKILCDERRQGWIFETICLILIILKCIDNINYTEISGGQLQNLKQIKNINDLLKIKVEGGGNNLSDMTIKNGTTTIAFTIKYKKKYGETDVSKLDNTISKETTDYKIGLIVKDKKVVIKHKYKNKLNIDKKIHDTIIENNLLFDETDIINALDVFCQRFSNNELNINDFIDFINGEYLLSPRKQLVKKLHQEMTLQKFIQSFLTQKYNMWSMSHKPRSGKSITMLLKSNFLLENGYNKILFMTSVPATINSFISDLDTYIDFKNINYKLQEEFDTIDESFNGIIFCSVQYLKTDGGKKKLLQSIGFDAIFIDESHQGSSTDKTKTEILEIDSDMEDICKNIKLKIFASGTSYKTNKYFGIHHSCIYEWEIEDEAYMKELIKSTTTLSNKENIIEYMSNRHGNTFIKCLENETLNKDYSKHPTQVLMKYTLPDTLIKEINTYNTKNGTNFGYSCSSLFALRQQINAKGEIEYVEQFELSTTIDGTEILLNFFECIISSQQMKNTIMKQIENTQTNRSSRKSIRGNPLLFIMYLPIHTRNNTISLLQKTLKQFLEINTLWSDYNIEYSNSIEDTGDVKEDYNEYLKSIMNKTRIENKRGCILLLGNKGSVGITYNDCDVTISLDDGHHLDNQKQRFSRALTESDGKTIGINVDMNIQRTYLYVIDVIQKHRKNTKTTKTNAEILYYLFEQNIFLFDPHQINNGKLRNLEIRSYYQKEVENMMNLIDDTFLLENIICDDDMRQFIKLDFQKKEMYKINTDLEGEQQDCPKGDKTKTQIDAPINMNNDNDTETVDNDNNDDIENTKIEFLINQTYEMCKSFLFPLLALISRSYKIFDFKDIFINEKTKGLIISLLKDKKIELNEQDYIIITNIMNNIIDNNAEIVQNIREIYSIAPARKLRQLIEKHFIPTNEERKKNAEVPTPVKLVDEMLNTIPDNFWKTPQKVFEPCCGKGNFVLGIFDRFYKGLEDLFPDEIDRCRVIMSECIYYADLTALNVFITTEIMKCHVQSCCGLDELDYEFNFHTGDTLVLDINNKFGMESFNAVIGNPPYNDNSGNKGKGHTLWTKFIERSLQEWINLNGYLLFVNPSLWRQPEHPLQDLMKSKQIIYLEIHDEKDGLKTFNCNTRYDIYLIQNKSYETPTTIKTQKKEMININLKDWDFIPNYNFEIIEKIIKGNEKINIIHSESKYEVRRPHMSHNESEIFKYPCIYSINRLNELSFKWSNTTDKGMFNVPKVIFGSGATGFIVDVEGKYGLTQWATGIVDDNIENLENIKKVLDSTKFKDIILATSVSKAEINRKILKYFKKDFWIEFI